MKYFSTLLLSLIFSGLNAQINCTDCPNTVFIDGILTSEIEIIVDGPDDISQNPLQEICLTLQHTWLSDAVVSLESPDGLHYMLLGDDDNTWGGCWSGSEDHANVCFVLGNDAPLTDGQPFGAFCTGTDYCLEGDYTPACGDAAYTPDGLGIPAPNCDINDYNVSGNTIGGTWIMRVYCVCMAEGDPSLDNWSLNFQNNSVISNTGGSFCGAYGGIGAEEANQFICNNATDQIVFNPEAGAGQTIPLGNGFLYGKIVVFGSTIYNMAITEDLTPDGWPAGTYDIYGVSLNENSLSSLMSFNGSSLNALLSAQGSDESHCFSLSSNPKPIIVIEDDGISFEEVYPRICPGESFTLSAEGGTDYLWTGPNGFTSTNQTISISNPDELDSGMYSCEVSNFSYCMNVQSTEVSFRCENRVVDLNMGEETILEFDGIVSTGDECQDAMENTVTIGMSGQDIYIWGQNVGTELVCFQAYENGLLKNFTYEVTVLNPTSVYEHEINLKVIPNPASNFVQISANDLLIESASFYDTKGSLVQSISVNDTYKNVDLSTYPEGLYLIKIETVKGTITSKLVVNK